MHPQSERRERERERERESARAACCVCVAYYFQTVLIQHFRKLPVPFGVKKYIYLASSYASAGQQAIYIISIYLSIEKILVKKLGAAPVLGSNVNSNTLVLIFFFLEIHKNHVSLFVPMLTPSPNFRRRHGPIHIYIYTHTQVYCTIILSVFRHSSHLIGFYHSSDLQ